MNENKLNIIKDKFSSVEIVDGKGYIEIFVALNELHELCYFLKNEKDFGYDYQFCMTAVDNPDYFLLVYHFENTETKECVVVKAKTEGRENPFADTVCDIWPSSEFFEREVFDLFGIKFKNHPDLRRIFLEDDWQGYPLRKDYIDEINIIER